jgi:hypothetical protein
MKDTNNDVLNLTEVEELEEKIAPEGGMWDTNGD